MSAAGWAGLAGVAGFLGNKMQTDAANEQKQQLLQMQQDAEQKRQMMLAKYNNDLSTTSHLQEKAADRAATADDVQGQFQDPETGNTMGRTRSGKAVILNQTSNDYQDQLKAQMAARLANSQAIGAVHQSRVGGNPNANPNYGTGQPAPGGDAVTAPAAPAPQAVSPTQPAAPSVQQLMAQANAAAQAVGNDPQKQAAIGDRLKQLMTQYGYDDGSAGNAQ